MDQAVINYITEARGHGLTDEQIKQNMLGAGWDNQTIAEAFSSASAIPSTPEAGVRQAQFTTPGSAVQNNGVQMETPALVQPISTSSAPRKKKILAIILGIILLAILAGGGYYAYAYIYNTPTKVWQKFTQSPGASVYQNSYSFSYSDPNKLSADDQKSIGFLLQDIKLSLTGKSYFNLSDQKNLQSTSDIQYTFSSGSTSFSTGFSYKLLNNILYVNVGSNPILSLFMQSSAGGKKSDWIKFDLNQTDQNGTAKNQATQLQELLDPSFKQELQKIWNSSQVVKVDSFVGREKINGVTTLHFKNSVDKKALGDALNQYVDTFAKKIKSQNADVSDNDIATAKTVLAAIIQKAEIKQFETWVGMLDAKLYKVHVVTNAPSVISLAKNAGQLSYMNTGNGDIKRIADIRQIASALELYYNDQNGYPDGKDGKPMDLTPTYIGQLPVAPTPSGSCSNFYNTYWYTPMGTKTITKDKKTVYSSYLLTFCLGAATSGYPAGIAKLTPSGIEGGITCTGTKDQCSQNNPDQDNGINKQITDFVSKLDFSGEINVDSSFSDYGKVLKIDVPADAVDLSQSSRDAQRIADIRQLASALELYFNDNNSYPKQLSDLSPTYMGKVPTAPTQADGSCSETQNTYSYQYEDSNTYKIDFCLGQAIGGYSAGAHSLSQAGIK